MCTYVLCGICVLRTCKFSHKSAHCPGSFDKEVDSECCMSLYFAFTHGGFLFYIHVLFFIERKINKKRIRYRLFTSIDRSCITFWLTKELLGFFCWFRLANLNWNTCRIFQWMSFHWFFIITSSKQYQHCFVDAIANYVKYLSNIWIIQRVYRENIKKWWACYVVYLESDTSK